MVGNTSGGRKIPFLEEGSELLSSFVDAPSDGSLGDAQDGCSGIVRHAVDAHQDERHTQSFAQPVDALAKCFVLPSTRELFGRLRGRLATKCFESSVLGSERLGRRLSAPEVIEREVHCDAVEPRKGLTSPVKGRDRAIGANERLLRDVFGRARVSHHVTRETMNARVVTLRENAVGSAIACLCAQNEIAIALCRAFVRRNGFVRFVGFGGHGCAGGGASALLISPRSHQPCP